MEKDQFAMANVIAARLLQSCPAHMFMFAALKDIDVCFDLDKKTPLIWFDLGIKRLGFDKTARVIIKQDKDQLKFIIDNLCAGNFDERFATSKNSFTGESEMDILNTVEQYLEKKFN